MSINLKGFFGYNFGIKLEINRKIFGEHSSIWKLNHTLLNYSWVKEEMKKEIRRYFKLNGNENMSEGMGCH